jgi:hypothetical protein
MENVVVLDTAAGFETALALDASVHRFVIT